MQPKILRQIYPIEQTYELKSNDKISTYDEFVLEVNRADSWDGIRIIYPLIQNNTYLAELEVIPSCKNILFEVILPTEKGEIRINSFILTATRRIQFVFVPLHYANSIALRISSFGGHSIGKATIRSIKVLDLFPIIDHNDLISKIKLLGPWFHQIELSGIKTRLVNRTDSPSRQEGFVEYFTEQDFIDNPNWIWSKFRSALPKMKGLEVLDIACNAGFYSFELAKMGAKVLGIDNSYEDIVRAKFAKNVLGLDDVDFDVMDVNNMVERIGRKFDLALCLGLLYHVENPTSVINSVSKLSDVVIFETVANLDSQERKLINDKTITTDGYVPTIPWLENAFREAGFTEILQITKSDFPRAIFKCQK